jgi:hypothetical protein
VPVGITLTARLKERRPRMASQAAPPDGDFKQASNSESIVRSPSISSGGPEGQDEGDIRPADYDTETVERVYRYELCLVFIIFPRNRSVVIAS